MLSHFCGFLESPSIKKEKTGFNENSTQKPEEKEKTKLSAKIKSFQENNSQ